MSEKSKHQTTKTFTIDELAAAAGITEDAMLRRIAEVISKRPWHRRVGFHWRANMERGQGWLVSLMEALKDA